MPISILQLTRWNSRLHQENWDAGLAERWRRWRFRWGLHKERKALRDIADDPHMLSDLGLTRKQALEEADKPFWR
jgi:uncharacterized protein YjiS (DUF1127 family)